VTFEDWNKIDVAISNSYIIWLLRIDFAEFGLECFIRFEKLGDWSLGMFGEVRDEAPD
jgi:hypothetical protein